MEFLALVFEEIFDDAMMFFRRIKNLFVRTTVQILCMIVCTGFFVGFVFVSELLVFDILHIEGNVLAVFLFMLFYVICLFVFVFIIKLIKFIMHASRR